MASTISPRPFFALAATLGLAVAATFGISTAASAATVISGPIDLGTAESYGVLGATGVTNTGPTVINGDLGVSPGTSLTGFTGAPTGGEVDGETHQTDTEAAQAQADALTAYNVAASLSPTRLGMGELAGQSLAPGVYTGGALALSGGNLTLAGSASSVWVFQASSTLTIGSGANILFTGGATSCNVFWQVGSSATIGTGAAFEGTVLAHTSVTANTDATIAGRLIALNGAVTLQSNVITPATGCTPGTVSDTPAPEITSGEPTDATAGTPYSFTVTAEGTPSPTYTVTQGTLPAGLSLDSTTGVISGTPTTPGSSTFTVTAGNGQSPDASAIYEITVAAPAPIVAPVPPSGTAGLPATGAENPGELAASGGNALSPVAGVLLLVTGAAFVLFSLRRRLST